MPARTLTAHHDIWPVAGRFTISRGSRTEAHTVSVAIREGQHRGRGECVPYARYGESVGSVRAALDSMRAIIERGSGREELLSLMPAGAARNAIDCALIDLEAKRSGLTPAALLKLDSPQPVTTCYTISLAAPEEMAAKARAAAGRPLLKLKLGGAGDVERLAAVRAAVPGARLLADANESWSEPQLPELFAAAARARLELIEQPLPADRDAALAGFARTVPVCADESAHTSDDLAALSGRYDAVNIKLDKTGGLTEAVRMAAEARRLGFDIMLGCMLATSLSMAPAMLLAGEARWVDLDGPLLLARDREPALRYEGSLVHPASPDLWG